MKITHVITSHLKSNAYILLHAEDIDTQYQIYLIMLMLICFRWRISQNEGTSWWGPTDARETPVG